MPLLSNLQEFKGLWTRKTLEENPSRLSDLENLRTTPEGALRIRAGTKKPVQTGGTYDASSPIVTGSQTAMCTGGVDLHSARPVIIRRTAAGAFSEDLSQQAFLALFTAATVGERFYIISPGGKFSTAIMQIGRANANLTIVWKYVHTGGDSASTVAEQFGTTGEKIIRFSPPTSPTWDAAQINGYFGWAIYAEISVVGGGPVIPRICQKLVTGDFPSRRTLIFGSSDTQTSPTSAKLWRYAPNTSLQTRFSLIDDNGGSGLDAGFDAPIRTASHDGVLYWTNGFVQRSFQGDPALNRALGYTKPATAGFAAAVGAAGNLTGVFLYAVAYGYGPNGARGKSSPIVLTGTPPAPAAQKVEVTFPTEVTSLTVGVVDVVYVYRSWALDGAPATQYNSVPMYQIAAVARQDTDGTFPLNGLGNAGYTDNVADWPAPLNQMDSRDRTPPSRCKIMFLSKNRMILGNSREKPATVWVSLPGEFEAYDTLSGNGEQSFTSAGGDEVTAGIDFNDMAVIFTNRSMHGIIGLDSDDWTPITIHPEIGCVAAGSVQVAYGRLFWLADSGPWMWDGVNEPEYLGWPVRLEACSILVHGMSRGVCYDYGYELELIPSDRGGVSYATQWPSSLYGTLFTKYHYSLRTKEWSKTRFSNTPANFMQPIFAARWPLGSDYDGRPAPVYARHRAGNFQFSDLDVWLGEATNKDDGSDMTWLFEVPYGPWKSGLLIPERWEVDADGMGSVATSITNATTIGEKPVIQATPGTDGSSSLTMYQSGFTNPGTGCAVLNLKASGILTGGEREGYVYAAFLYGRKFQRKQPL